MAADDVVGIVGLVAGAIAHAAQGDHQVIPHQHDILDAGVLCEAIVDHVPDGIADLVGVGIAGAGQPGVVLVGHASLGCQIDHQTADLRMRCQSAIQGMQHVVALACRIERGQPSTVRHDQRLVISLRRCAGAGLPLRIGPAAGIGEGQAVDQAAPRGSRGAHLRAVGDNVLRSGRQIARPGDNVAAMGRSPWRDPARKGRVIGQRAGHHDLVGRGRALVLERDGIVYALAWRHDRLVR